MTTTSLWLWQSASMDIECRLQDEAMCLNNDCIPACKTETVVMINYKISCRISIVATWSWSISCSLACRACCSVSSLSWSSLVALLPWLPGERFWAWGGEMDKDCWCRCSHESNFPTLGGRCTNYVTRGDRRDICWINPCTCLPLKVGFSWRELTSPPTYLHHRTSLLVL